MTYLYLDNYDSFLRVVPKLGEALLYGAVEGLYAYVGASGDVLPLTVLIGSLGRDFLAVVTELLAESIEVALVAPARLDKAYNGGVALLRVGEVAGEVGLDSLYKVATSGDGFVLEVTDLVHGGREVSLVHLDS